MIFRYSLLINFVIIVFLKKDVIIDLIDGLCKILGQDVMGGDAHGRTWKISKFEKGEKRKTKG